MLPAPQIPLPRLRQAVLAARDLGTVAGRLRETLRLQEPFADPGVAYFGLRNAVFALGDTFLEVVSPERPDTSAGRLLERRGDDCGYMIMLQVDDLGAARERARGLGIREVFEVSLDDIAEVHLHPLDIGGAIVSLSRPEPARSWRWGGPDWEQRSASVTLAGAVLAVRDPAAVQERWATVLGEPPAAAGIEFVADQRERGLVELRLSGNVSSPVDIGGVTLVSATEEENR